MTANTQWCKFENKDFLTNLEAVHFSEAPFSGFSLSYPTHPPRETLNTCGASREQGFEGTAAN